jgi:hypothetical protein
MSRDFVEAAKAGFIQLEICENYYILSVNEQVVIPLWRVIKYG